MTQVYRAKTRSLGRMIPILAGSAMVTAGIFGVMNMLVASDGEIKLDERKPHRFINYSMFPPTPPEPLKTIEIEKPKPVEIEPVTETGDPVPECEGPCIKVLTLKPTVIPNSGPVVDLGPSADGDMMPIVILEPTYPRRAAERDIEGYALISLTVTADGMVADAEVLEAEPAGYFESAALKAVNKFKYKPRVVNGRAMPVSGVQYKMTFNLAE